VVGVAIGSAGVLLLLGLTAYLVRVGLDKADKLASVVGAFVGLMGLALGIFESVRGGSKAAAPTQSQAGDQSVSNSISGSVSGNVVQAKNIKGDIDLHSKIRDREE
jgi:hypothetical protein